MKVLFLFLDGIGLGSEDAAVNPFAAASMPTLEDLLKGTKLVEASAPLQTDQTTLLGLDACLGVAGLPQSATGQAALLTGINVPAQIGYHYGPKPNPEVAEIVRNGNLFNSAMVNGKNASLLNAYPPRYFEAIESGLRMYSTVPLAVTSAGLSLNTVEDFYEGRAISADFTGKGWREHLGYADSPVREAYQAGHYLASLADGYELSFFEFWLSDLLGHQQDMERAVSMLQEFDQVLNGLLASWDFRKGIILITSDHGNLEDLSTRRHTTNPVPAIIIGERKRREEFGQGLTAITGITPAIKSLLLEEGQKR